MPLNTDPPPPCRIGPCGRHCNCFNDIDWGHKGCQWCQILTEDQKLNEQLMAANLRISEMTDALNKIHDLAGQVGGSTANPEMTNLNLGAIQDWCHKLTEPCEKRLDTIAMPCGCDSNGGKCSSHAGKQIPEYQKHFGDRKTICIHCEIEVPGNVHCPKCGR